MEAESPGPVAPGAVALALVAAAETIRKISGALRHGYGGSIERRNYGGSIEHRNYGGRMRQYNKLAAGTVV